jgi:hypothetical protein
MASRGVGVVIFGGIVGHVGGSDGCISSLMARSNFYWFLNAVWVIGTVADPRNWGPRNMAGVRPARDF